MKYIFASDLDGTLIPTSEDVCEIQSIRDFSTYINNTETNKLVYVTGRDFELSLSGIDIYKLPVPDILICDVGTSLYERDAHGNFIKDSEYSDLLLKLMRGSEIKELIPILSDIEGLKLQKKERITSFKLSYYAPVQCEKTIVKIKQKLNCHNIEAEIVFSVDKEKDLGLIDILPPGVAKNSALDYLINKLGFNKNNLLYAGDSGNDLSVVQAGYRTVLVGNTSPEVRNEAMKLSKENPDRLYIAQTDCARGVIEGYEFFRR